MTVSPFRLHERSQHSKHIHVQYQYQLQIQIWEPNSKNKSTLNWPSVHAKSLQLCPTLCNLMDHSLPGSFVHGIVQARIPEWIVLLQRIFPTQGLNLRLLHLLHWQAGSLPQHHLESPNWLRDHFNSLSRYVHLPNHIS